MLGSRIRLGGYGALAAFAAIVGVAQLEGCGTEPGASTSEATPQAEPVATPAFVTLDRNVHPLARPEHDIGPLDPATQLSNLSVVFKLSPKQLLDREALKSALLDPGSRSYHKWLTPEDYAARFGASADDIARTSGWLTQQGLHVVSTSRLGSRVSFSGSVDAIQNAFHTEMHRYEVGNATHYAMASAPSIPADLADVVLALHNTHDFYPRPIGRAKKMPQYKSGTTLGLAPPDWAAIYDVAKLYTTEVNGADLTGTGVTIAIVGIAQIAQNDIIAFRTKFGLGTTSNVTMTLVPNTGAANPSSGAGMEAILDVEWSGGIAYDASINYVNTGANDLNVDDATYYAIEENLAPIISESWGGCEEGSSASEADVLATYGSAANLLGITYLAASGDQGAAGCIENSPAVAGLYVNMPASFPGVTAVGGTEFPSGTVSYAGTNDYATGYPAGVEETWNESNNPSSFEGVGAGGGGISTIFPRPSYQTQTTAPTCAIVGGLPVTETAANFRQVPDVALSAASGNNPYFIECTLNSSDDCAGTSGTPQIIPLGGTSASTPSFAGVVALLNQATGGRLGNINPLLYTLNGTKPTAFHDVVKGNNEIVCTTGETGCPSTGGKYGFAAGSGYDCATGLGSIDAYNLVTDWVALAKTTTALVPDPTTTSEGSDVTLTATVDVPTPNADTLSGTVTFTFQSYLADGTPDLSWTLGTAAIDSATASPSNGTAAISTTIPPGLVESGVQYVDVVAMYGGDAAHLASWSTKARITFAPISFCVMPVSSTVAEGAAVQFEALGGVTPFKWIVDYDSTCDTNGNSCSTLDEATGAFKAGTGSVGYVLVAALDAYGAESFADVKVGAATGAPPWLDGGMSTCPPPDAGAADAAGSTSDAGHASDAGTASDAGSTSTDAGTTADAGHSTDAGSATDAGATADAGHASDAGGTTGTDAGKSTDAGGSTDSGATGGFGDSGTTGDASASSDSGSANEDSGLAEDSGSENEDSGAFSEDSGASNEDARASLEDSGATALNDDAGQNGGTTDASASADGGSAGASSPSGCGCTTAGSSAPPTGMFGALALGLGLMIRRRRSRH